MVSSSAATAMTGSNSSSNTTTITTTTSSPASTKSTATSASASSSSSSSSAKPAPGIKVAMSYADRAKKAQNIKSSGAAAVSNLVQPAAVMTSSTVTAPNTAAAATNMTTSASASTTAPSMTSTSTNSSTTASKLSSSASASTASTDVTPGSSMILTRPQTRPSSPSSLPLPFPLTSSLSQAQVTPGTIVMNGADGGATETGTGTGTGSAVPAPPKPVVNVWSLRKEQMAQRIQQQQQQQQQHPSASSSPSQPQSSSHKPQGQVSGQNTARASTTPKSPLPISRNTSSADDNTASPGMTNVRPPRPSPKANTNKPARQHPPHPNPNPNPNATTATTININGAPVNANEEEEEPDPFVVRVFPHHYYARAGVIVNENNRERVKPTSSSLSVSVSTSPSATSSSSKASSSKAGAGRSAPPPPPTQNQQQQQKPRTRQAKGAQAPVVVQAPPVLPPAMDDVDSWPEVGKSVSVSVSAAGSGSDSGKEKEVQGDMSGSNGGGKKKAAKWVAIPPEELRATADALLAPSTSSRSRGNHHHPHKQGQGESSRHHNRAQGQGQGQRGSNSRSGSASGSTQGNGGQGGAGGQSRVHSGRNSTVQSVAPSTSSHSRVQSRTGSLQGSPKLGGGGGGGAGGNGKGRRLPVDDVFQVVKPGSPVRYTPPPLHSHPNLFPISASVSASTSGSGVVFPGTGAVPGPPDGSTYYIPHVHQPHYYPQSHSHPPYSHPHPHPHPHPQSQSQSHSHTNSGSNPNSHSNTHTHSPMMPGQYSTLPTGLNGLQQFPISVQGQRTGTGTPPYGMYQPQPQAQVYSTYDYTHGHVQGQPYPAYWSEHERHTHLPAPGVISPSSSSSSSSYHPPSQFGGIVPALAPMQLPPSQPFQLSLQQRAVEQHPQAPQLPLHQLHSQPLMFGQVEGDVPPPTMVLRPPPPEESEAVAGYREVAPVDSEAGAVEGQGQPQTSLLEGRGRKPTGVVFGSIGLGVDQSPSPSPMIKPVSEAPGAEGSGGADDGKEGTEEKPFTFSIGVTPGEPDLLRIRSRTRSTRARARSEGQLALDLRNGQVGAGGSGDEIEGKGVDGETNAIEVKATDSGDPDTKWEFGTTKHPEKEEEGQKEEPALLPPPQLEQPELNSDVPSLPAVGGDDGAEYISSQEQTVGLTSSPQLQVDPLPVTTPPNGLQMEAPIPLQSAEPLLSTSETSDWEVKDFGYGFGARERREERDKDREFIQGRPRRGSYPGGYGSYEYRGRRGRGFGGRGFTRGYRGGYLNQQRQPPPFTVTPPLSQFQASIPSPSDHTTTYYQHPPPATPIANYLPGYETYPPPPPPIQPVAPVAQGAPPVPTPITVLPYPLDPTSWYLLGQLEYYMSPQNLAQDLFLRKRMDSRGWIPIALFASFNRVKNLTMDFQLVKNIFGLSTIVQVQDDWVRMGGNQWERYILPDAPTSTLEPDHALAPVLHTEASRSDGDAENPDVEGEVEDEDDDDVVFVMNQDAEDSWAAGRRQTS